MNASGVSERARAELSALVRKLSYREGDFTLASGKKSPFYVDLKMTTLHPEGARMIGRLAALEISAWARRVGQPVGGVGGLTLGADPIATAVSLAALEQGAIWPAFIVRKEPKEHGTGKWVEGRELLDAAKTLVVLEDVVTTGGSSVKAIERLRAEGLKPGLVLTVVDRNQGGADAFKSMGVDFRALTTLKEVQGALQ